MMHRTIDAILIGLVNVRRYLDWPAHTLAMQLPMTLGFLASGKSDNDWITVT